MGQWIRWLKTITHADLPVVGGKGANLGEMYGAGLPVPQAFCVTTDAYRHQFLEPAFQHPLGALRAAHAEDLDALSQAIAALFEQTPMDDEIRLAILDAYATFPAGTRVAVRSSATAEDLPDASFAGQQETFLGVLGEDALVDAVRACWASLWAARAIHYREEQGFAHEIVALSVVVQQMVAAEVAGVMFTANPVSNDRDEIVITASFGLGESVVSGLVTPDTFTVKKDPTRLVRTELALKERQVIQADQGSEIVDVTGDQRRPSLDEAQVLEVAAMGCVVEQHYGSPQDIEWAIVDSTVYLLQTRPITTLRGPPLEIALPTAADHVHGWIDYGRIPRILHAKLVPAVVHEMLLDHFPEPLRPLDLDLCLGPVYSQLARTVRDLGFSVPTDIIVEHPSGLVLFRFPFPNLLSLGWRWPLVLWRIYRAPSFDPLREWLEVDQPDHRASTESLDAAADSVHGSEIVVHIRARMEALKETMHRRFSKYFKSGTVAHRNLVRILQRLDPDRADHLEHQLSLALPYQTALMNEGIKGLARIAHRTPAVRDALRGAVHGSQRGALRDIDHSADFLGAFQEFLAEHGSRAAVGMEPMPSYPSWHDAPENVLSMVSVMLGDPSSFEGTWEMNERIFEDAKAEVIAQLGSASAVAHFEESLSVYRGFWVAREATLHLFEEQVQHVRRVVRRLAEELVTTGLLDEADLVFYLTGDDLHRLIDTDDPDQRQAMQQLARHRERVWTTMREQLRDLSMTSVGIDADASVFRGAGASPGRATGRVCVVSGPQEFGKLSPGDVLVCAATSPAWTPLFSVAAAVVTDTGGLLSHAAIVAREYNIPAVMGCVGATRVLEDGWMVEVNGKSGEVRKL